MKLVGQSSDKQKNTKKYLNSTDLTKIIQQDDLPFSSSNDQICHDEDRSVILGSFRTFEVNSYFPYHYSSKELGSHKTRQGHTG